jgi:hypothetical protein
MAYGDSQKNSNCAPSWNRDILIDLTKGVANSKAFGDSQKQ